MPRIALAAAVFALGMMLCPTRGVAQEEGRPGEPYVAWIEDRYTETWSWLLKDAPVQIAGDVWSLDVCLPVREHGVSQKSPTVTFTLTPQAADSKFVFCDVDVIADDEALQGIRSDHGRRLQKGSLWKTLVSFTLSLEAFHKIAKSKTTELRLCGAEFKFDAVVLGALQGLAARDRAAPPPASERKLYREEQKRHEIADQWQPRANLREAWRRKPAEVLVAIAGGTRAQTLRVSSLSCGAGILRQMEDEDTRPLREAGFVRVECVGGAMRETLDL